VLAEDASIWYGAVLRGDNDLITIGRAATCRTAACCTPTTGIPLTLGEGVTSATR
jgi:carbonic anhydrase/acetyltransferase-like protein (isoleucine patch superfamily)